MLISGAPSPFQPHNVKADLTSSQSRSSQETGQKSRQFSSIGSAITLSLSITAITVTTDFLAAKVGEETEGNPSTDHPRARGIENALDNLMTELKENGGLTGKVAKRLFKLVSALNSARGTDIKLGEMDKDTRIEVRSARQRVNDFFRDQKSTDLFDKDLANFINMVAKLETLREFALRTTDLLEALKKAEPDDAAPDPTPDPTPDPILGPIPDPAPDAEQTSVIDIEA